jgi:hypothetical protein
VKLFLRIWSLLGMQRRLRLIAALCAPALLIFPAAASAAVSEGGPVMTTPTIYPIYWGNYWNVDPGSFIAKNQMNGLMNSFSGSAWQGILSQYWGSNGFVSKTVTRAQPYIDKRVVRPKNLTQAAITNEITEAIGINAGAGWPQSPTINDLFVVFLPYETTWAEAHTFCGYHQRNGAYPYAVVAWESSNNLCSHTVTLSHEFAESVTDPYPTESWGVSSSNREELADACTFVRGTLNGYEIADVEDNYLGGCREADANPPQLAPEFVTDAPTEVTTSSAMLQGHAVPRGVDVRRFYFQWGTSSVTEHSTELTAFWPPGTWTASAPISGLSSGTTYKYRLVVQDGEFPFNQQRGQIVEFKTP